MTAHTVIISYEIYKLVTENVLEIAKSILLYTVPMVQKRTKFIKKKTFPHKTRTTMLLFSSV
jgi:hypothetical protein